ncbi:MAG: gfo/Idh/MocA family oxidoreductase, partial [Planctomycetaceae bacterium]|jgi:hypothetical protein|nr:gfo/Idh/MocA family oxidoreductase [Planctomycetaceae bacterium]
VKENVIWEFKDKEKNMYQIEHDVLFDAIRNDKPHNETERCAKSGFVGILGRMACESGKEITWDEALASGTELAPNIDKLTMDSPAPVMPDADGNYPVAVPGVTRVI